jgi:hypothetical protein
MLPRISAPGLLALALALSGLAVRADVASTSPLVPDFVRMQYAGQAGLMSVGTGYSWWRRKVEVSANYGYVPLWVADRRVHVFSERNSFSLGSLDLPRHWALEPALGGVAANITLGNQYQVFLPKAQRDYYWPDALYFWVFTGAKLDYLPPHQTGMRGFGTQLEVGTINQYLKSYRENREVDLGDILSLSISAQLYL